MTDALRREVCALHMELPGNGLVAWTSGNLSARVPGEELMVILPGCNLEGAQIKAEGLRARIEGLSEAHGVAISASFGIAAVPETSTSPADVVLMADAALYNAKQAGKNCVRFAERRAGRDDQLPRTSVP